jgi:hypothetical protein
MLYLKDQPFHLRKILKINAHSKQLNEHLFLKSISLKSETAIACLSYVLAAIRISNPQQA